MKVEISFEGLEEIIKSAAQKNTEEAIEDAIKDVIRQYVENNYRQLIEESVNLAIQTSIQNHLASSKITVGNPFAGDEVKEYTPNEYINMKIGNIFEENCFTIKEKDSYYSSGYREKKVSFEDYIKKEFNYQSIIESEMKKFTANFKRDLNNYFKETYTKELQNTLCATVVDVIMQDSHFKSISDKISNLG